MSYKTIEGVFQHLCEGLDTKASRHLLELFRDGKHRELVESSIDFDDYTAGDVSRFRDDYLIHEYLSKYKGLKTGIDTKRAALDSFQAAEIQCDEANERIDAFLYRNGSCDWVSVICRAQQKIESCIGPYPKVSKLLSNARWGKGSTFSLKGEDARLDYKLREGQISVTKQAKQYLRAAMATDYAWLRARGLDVSGPTSLLDSEFAVVKGSRGLTVDKNAKTDRFIAAEPSGNIFLQLGAATYLRRCLRRIGIDLDDQSVNQNLAAVALDRGLATVDLKAASDTIPRAIVWLLLPYSWASYLNDLRSPQMYVDGRWTFLSKFSSMGNGFTFELESLIFWSLTEALRDQMGESGRVSVYGDDIICPSSIVPQLRELLGWCGFTFNVKKTHYTGYFRESCGKHFYEGKDVTPIYQKEDPDKNREEYYRCHNRLLYHAIDRGSEDGAFMLADRKLKKLILWVRRQFVSRFPYGKEHMVPILPRAIRELEGGLATDSRQLTSAIYGCTGRNVPEGTRISCKVWAFKPKVLPDASSDALFAVSLRRGYGRATLSFVQGSYYAPKNWSIPWPYGLTLHRREVAGLKSLGTWELGDLPKHSILADELTARRQGRYRTQVRHYPEFRDLHWA